MKVPSTRAWKAAGRALTVPNFRRYIIGQGISHLGQWFQTTAELWLILTLTGSGFALGLHSVLRFSPILLFGTYGGLISDRVDRRRLLITTQSIHACLVTLLVVALVWWEPSLVLIYAIVLAQGLVNAIDNPLRRSFVRDLVTDDELSNAVSLHAMVNTTTRALGPALAGLMIAGLGLTACFGVNAVSYAGVLVSLFTIKRDRLRKAEHIPRRPGQLREGFKYAWTDRKIKVTLVLVGVISTFAWNWNIVLPVYSTDEFAGGAAQYGMMVSVLSAGAFFGGLYTARAARLGGRHLMRSVAAIGCSLTLAALAPTMLLALASLFVLGASGTSFTVGAQARLQLSTKDDMSGRVMALYSVGFLGSKPLGGLIGGWLIDGFGPRWAFAFGGGAVVVTMAVLALSNRAFSRSGAVDDRGAGRAYSGPITPETYD